VLPVLQHRPHTGPNTVSNAIPDPIAYFHWLRQLVGQLRQSGMEYGAWGNDRNLSQQLQLLVLH